MKVLTITKRLVFSFLFISISFTNFGQNCSSVSGKKDKQKGIETFSGVTTSKDFYSLLIQKQIDSKDSLPKPKYCLYLIASSRILFSDSIIKAQGKMEVKLIDNSFMNLENVSFSNNPLGSCCSLGFKTYLTEDQIKAVSINPIATITCLDFTTSFSNKSQKEQQRIIGCLIDKH